MKFCSTIKCINSIKLFYVCNSKKNQIALVPLVRFHLDIRKIRNIGTENLCKDMTRQPIITWKLWMILALKWCHPDTTLLAKDLWELKATHLQRTRLRIIIYSNYCKTFKCNLWNSSNLVYTKKWHWSCNEGRSNLEFSQIISSYILLVLSFRNIISWTSYKNK